MTDHILYATDKNYCELCAVSLYSLLSHLKGEAVIHIIESNLEERKADLQKIADEFNSKIEFIPIDDISRRLVEAGIPPYRGGYSPYARFFISDYVSEGRVLYLDCDTLCHGDLLEFWNMDLGDNYCGAVTDAVGEHYYELFDMNKTSRYCNSGMVLFDLKRWREDGMEDKVADYVRKKNGFVFFMEQSVMNIVLQDRIKILHPKYNTYTLISALSNQELRWLRHCKRLYGKEELEEAKRDPRLIHLTNLFLVKGRPWIEGNNHPYKEIFMSYRTLTPWKNETLMKEKISKLKQIEMSIIRSMPRWISLPIIGIVYEYIRPRQIARQHA
jgi:lipopolysaccharide biosynthesis glycosyltransferase